MSDDKLDTDLDDKDLDETIEEATDDIETNDVVDNSEIVETEKKGFIAKAKEKLFSSKEENKSDEAEENTKPDAAEVVTKDTGEQIKTAILSVNRGGKLMKFEAKKMLAEVEPGKGDKTMYNGNLSLRAYWETLTSKLKGLQDRQELGMPESKSVVRFYKEQK